jgi:hypothetical protein
VLLIRNKKLIPLMTETSLKRGDIVATDGESSIEVALPGVKIDLPSGSQIQIEGGPAIRALYGHFRIQVDVQGPKIFKLLLPTAEVKTEGDRPLEFYAHILKDENTFHQEIGGNFLPPPSITQARQLGKEKSLFTEIDSYQGNLDVQPQKSAHVKLHAGDRYVVRGASGDFAPKSSSVSEIRAANQVFRFTDSDDDDQD